MGWSGSDLRGVRVLNPPQNNFICCGFPSFTQYDGEKLVWELRKCSAQMSKAYLESHIDQEIKHETSRVIKNYSFTAFHCAKDSARAHPFCQGCQKAWHQSHLLKVIFTDHWLGGLCAARFPSEPKRASEIKKKST